MGQDCKYCGAYIASAADKCPACGKRINYKEEAKNSAYGAAAAEAYRSPEPEQESRGGNRSETAGSYSYSYRTDAQDPRTAYTAASQSEKSGSTVEREDQLLSFLCYFGPLLLVPYLLRPKSDFVRFHCNQGIVLLLSTIIINVAAEIIPFFGWILSIFASLFFLACLLKGLINVYRMEKKELPLIGSFRIFK